MRKILLVTTFLIAVFGTPAFSHPPDGVSAVAPAPQDQRNRLVQVEPGFTRLLIDRIEKAAQFGEQHPTVKALDAELAAMKSEFKDLVAPQTELEQALVPLLIERNKHSAKFGEGHPTVKALDAQLAAIRGELKRLVQRQSREPQADVARWMDFLRPGTKMAVRADKESGLVHITILTNEWFAIAKDSTVMELAELAAKYKRVAAAVEAKENELRASIPQLMADLPSHMRIGEPKMHFQSSSGTLGEVVQIGEDYLILSFTEGGKRNRERKRLYPSRFIRSIEWHDGEPDVFGTIPRVRRK